MPIVNGVPVTTPQTSYRDAALAIIDDVRGLKERVPNFVIPESKAASQKLARAASVPQQFVDLTELAIRNNEELTRGGNSGQDLIHDLSSYAGAFAPVADELEAMALFIRHSVRSARHKAGSEALTTYALAKRLARRPETADLAPHVVDMRNALFGPGRKSRRKSKPAPTPATPGSSSDPTQLSPVTSSSPATPTKQ